MTDELIELHGENYAADYQRKLQQAEAELATLRQQMEAVELYVLKGTLPGDNGPWSAVLHDVVKLRQSQRQEREAAKEAAFEEAAILCDKLTGEEGRKEGGDDSHGLYARLAWTAPRIRALKKGALGRHDAATQKALLDALERWERTFRDSGYKWCAEMIESLLRQFGKLQG